MQLPSNNKSAKPVDRRVVVGGLAALITSAALAACSTNAAPRNDGAADPPGVWGVAPWSTTDAGVPIICNPGLTAACYSGPPGTLGVGTCVAGKRTCNEDGTGFGPCSGEIAADAPACSGPGSTDCQGTAACAIKTLWAAGFSEGGYPRVESILANPAGNILIAGDSAGPLDLGTGALSFGPKVGDVAPRAGVIAQFGPGGAPLTSHALTTGGKGDLELTGLARDGIGNVYASATLSAYGLAINGSSEIGPRNLDAVLIKLNALGDTVWTRQFGDQRNESGQTVSVSASGNVCVTGTITDDVDPYHSERFITCWSSEGVQLWSKEFTGWSDSPIFEALDAKGNLYLAGNFAGSIDIGGGPMESHGNVATFLAKLDVQGHLLWSKKLGGEGSIETNALAMDAQGNLLLTGSCAGPADFGGAPLKTFLSPDIHESKVPFVAKLDSKGDHVWSRAIGNTTSRGRGLYVAVAQSGDVSVVGTSEGVGSDSSSASTIEFLARVSAAGVPLAGRTLGSEDNHKITAVGVDPGGALILAGQSFASVDLGDGEITVDQGQDGFFLAKLSP
jgi:hypothetical protein